MGKRKKNLSFAKCLELMKKSDSLTQENGFWSLFNRAELFTTELMLAFEQENDYGLRCWLLELLSEGRDPVAIELLKREALGQDDSFKFWAIIGLKAIDTKETRTFLYQNSL